MSKENILNIFLKVYMKIIIFLRQILKKMKLIQICNTTRMVVIFLFWEEKMINKKVKKIIRKKLYEYTIYVRLLNELNLEKDTTEESDINSSIRSKYK